MKWYEDENMTDKVDIIKRHISLLDNELRKNCNVGFEYHIEDRLLDLIYDVLITNGNLIKMS